MKLLLVAINASYIHANLGIYSLAAYAKRYAPDSEVCMAEYTINHNYRDILQSIYEHHIDTVGFSCYIWNIDYVLDLVCDLKAVNPGMTIILGGPEVSYRAESLLKDYPQINIIMRGEGEETLAELLKWDTGTVVRVPFCQNSDQINKSSDNGTATTVPVSQIPILGLTYRDASGQIHVNEDRELMDMDKLVFPYTELGLETDDNRIIYYESSRGCPYRCSYCLSSIDKKLRLKSMDIVYEELAWFIDGKPKQVKFVDRTANADKRHFMNLLKFITEHDNGVTNFHFEIAAEVMDEDEINMISHMRPGLIQLEIGVQTVNPDTLKEIRRPADIDKLSSIVKKIHDCRNTHVHLDLIAGLPYENLESFKNSFDVVYGMKPDQLQLGFLKVLSGSYMEEMAGSYKLTYTEKAPYEVLSTQWLNYDDIIELKLVEDMVENYYNSRQFDSIIEILSKDCSSAYDMFKELGLYYKEHKLNTYKHNRLDRYNILYAFINHKYGCVSAQMLDALMNDIYLREDIKKRPEWAPDRSAYSDEIKNSLRRYTDKKARCHIEITSSGKALLYDYDKRDPLSGNADVCEISLQ